MPEFPDHLHIVGHAFAYPLGFDQFVLAREIVYPLFQVKTDLSYSRCYALFRCDEYVCGIYLETVVLSERYSVDRVYGRYGFNLIAPENHSQYYFLVGQTYVYRIAFDAEIATPEINLVA